MIKRGASLVWTIIICSVLMVVATTMATAVIKESQMSVRMDDSARAYAAAESGIEWSKWCLSDYSSDGCFSSITPSLWRELDGTPLPAGEFVPREYALGTAKYSVAISANCQKSAAVCPSAYTIKSTGSSGTVNRAIEYSSSQDASKVGFGPKDDGSGYIDNLKSNLDIPGSFTAEFSYWQPRSTTPLDTDSLSFIKGNDSINIIFYSDGLNLKVKKNGLDVENPVSAAKITYPAGFDRSRPYGTKIRLTYVAGVAARLDVLDGTSQYLCIGSRTVGITTPLVFGSGTALSSLAGSSTFLKIDASTDTGSSITQSGASIYKYTVPGLRAGYFGPFTTTGVDYTPVASLLSVAASLGTDYGQLQLVASGTGSSSYLVETSRTGSAPWAVATSGSGTITTGQTVNIPIS